MPMGLLVQTAWTSTLARVSFAASPQLRIRKRTRIQHQLTGITHDDYS
jgi:hypothetical protein